jgi:hypothetical protein
MADRYWVGGTGAWNTTSTTNWSATSGGASGASVPTSADDVIFNQAGTYTVTMNGALTCLSFTVSAGTVTFAQISHTLNIAGSISLIVGTVWTASGSITFSSTTTGRTIDFGNVSLPASLVFNGVGGGWTLTRSFTSTGVLTLTNGIFSTGTPTSYNMTVAQVVSDSGTSSTLNLNSSTVNITSTLQPWRTTSSAFTLNAGTSQINFTGAGGSIVLNLNYLTFYNVAFTASDTVLPRTIPESAFNNLSITKSAFNEYAFEVGSLTINGTLSFVGSGRVYLYGDNRIASTLTINAVSALTDIDFRNIYVVGAAAPLSGTRIGNAGNLRGISASTPKTVYWNRPTGGDWYSNASPGWALSSGGAVSINNFPLPQDTAIIENTGLNSGSTITLNGFTTINDAYIGTIDMSSRSLPMTLAGNSAYTIYSNWSFSSSVTNSFTGDLIFSALQKDQFITSAGRSFTSNIIVDSLGGTLKLLDTFNQSSTANNLEMRTGTFDTNNVAVTVGSLTTSSTSTYGSAPISIFLRSSIFTVRFAVTLSFAQNLTLDAGTSTVICIANSISHNFGNLTYNNISFTSVSNTNTSTIIGNNTFQNFSCSAPSSNGYSLFFFSGNQTINGTLTCAGATATRRISLRSDTSNTPRTLTVNAISATDCDFRDITIAGAASGTSITRAGDCGGNTGITFPAPKSVYWNLAGSQNWSATGWAASSGGTPAINNFPLPQDTAVFDNAGAAGTITIERSFNIGTLDASLRTSAMALGVATNIPEIYGDWKFGTGVTSSNTTGTILFQKNGTQTITSNGVSFGHSVQINDDLANVQLADAISLQALKSLVLGRGTFDAVIYNVTVPLFSNNTTNTTTLRMGSGTWTLNGTSTVWDLSIAPNLFVGTSTIVLSNTSTTARTFNGGGFYYNKLTIGGATGISTLTITGNNIFGELASTKTVAHTIAFGTTNQTFGKWSVTGTVGNVVTITGTGTGTIAGPAVTGVNYLAMGTWFILNTSPGEFYAGANSTGSAGSPVFRTAAPAPRTLYWVNGTGTWATAANWSLSSGGAGGEPIPTSLDAVVFDSASSASNYSAQMIGGTLARCASFTMAGPASGIVTLTGTLNIAFHGNVSFAATGVARSYTGAISWAGNGSYTFTTNGLALASACTVVGIGSTWTLGSPLNIGTSTVTVTYGAFSTSASNYSLTAGGISSSNLNVRSISLNGSTVVLSLSAAITFTSATNLNLDAGTSTIQISNSAPIFNSAVLTFNNVSFTSPNTLSISINGENTFNNLTFTGRTTVGINTVTFSANQNISTLTLNAGTASAYRTFLRSGTFGLPRTLTVGTLAAGATDIDFRDITIAGAAAPISGTRFGDAKGNSGITFPAAKTVYWALATAGDWGAAGSGTWAAISGGAPGDDQFPLAQDTAYITPTRPGSGLTITVNAAYNIGTVDISTRTLAMTLATSTQTPTIYGNWFNGTATTLTGTGVLTFAGRGSQTITSAGRTFTQPFSISTPGGSVTLLDALTLSSTTATNLVSGTFNAQIYNVTLSARFNSTSSEVRAVNFGSGTWTFTGGSAQGMDLGSANTSNLTISGSGTISFANNSTAIQIYLYGKDFSGITFNQAGSRSLQLNTGLPVTIKNITNTYSATGATSIEFIGQGVYTFRSFTATGAAGRVLSLIGNTNTKSSIVIDDSVASGIDYLSIRGLAAYPLENAWYAGTNSTNFGSLGWQFQNIPVNYGKFFLMFG